MGLLEDVRLRELGKQAEKAAEAQRIAEAARLSGVNDAVKGLAALGAQQAYMDTVSPQGVQQVPAGVEVGGREFVMSAPNGGSTSETDAYMNAIRARKAADGLAAQGLR